MADEGFTIHTIRDDKGKTYVDEELFFAVLCRIAKLINDQRTALRTHDKDLIAECKKRENGLLTYVGNYANIRSGIIQTELFKK